MRLLTVLFILLGASPASANSIEDALCRESSVSVVQMDSPEKLCRSFARALHRLPQATGASPPTRLAPTESSPPKIIDLEAFARWIQSATRRPVRDTREAYRYQQAHAGPEEVLVQGGGKKVWADGPRMDSARLVESKYIEPPEKIPFIAGSKCNEKVRLRIQQEVTAEFQRYAAVISDPTTPAVALEVIVNDARAVPFFESLLRTLRIPGEVLVKP